MTKPKKLRKKRGKPILIAVLTSSVVVAVVGPVLALVYFFKGLAEIERSTKDYESAQCRLGNSASVAVFSSPDILPSLWDLMRTEDGQRTKSYQSIRARVKKLPDEPPPSRSPSTCAKMAQQDLAGMHQEMRSLFLRVAKDAALLYAKIDH